jgi:ABC-type xylose transport system permease subunit
MASPGKFSINFSKFPEGGLILAMIVLGLLLAVFGGIVQLPKFHTNAAGKQERVMVKNAAGIGGNETASRYSGIRVEKVKILVYTISGLTAGIAAVLSLGYYGAGSSGDGQGYELNVIAASVVGGASLVGGKGTALGALLGAVILQMISNGLVILNIPQNYSQIVIGLVVIAAVLFDQFNAWLANRRLLAKTGRIKKEVIATSETPVSITPQSK